MIYNQIAINDIFPSLLSSIHDTKDYVGIILRII